MNRRKNKVLCAAIILLLAVSLMACGKEKYRMVKIENYDGDVELKRDGDVELFEGINLIPDDKVETGDESEAMLLVDDDKHLVAGANTKFTVNASGTEENGLVSIDIAYGQALIKIENKLSDDSKFEVNTPNATFSVRGTTFGVSYDKETGESKLVVYEGKVKVDNGDSKEVIEAGSGAVVTEDRIDMKEDIVTVIDKDDDMPSMEEFESDSIDIAYEGTDAVDNEEAAVASEENGDEDVDLADNQESEMTYLSKANIGDTVYFGTYDYGDGNGEVPVEWDVLEKEDGMVLLISHYILEYHAFDQEGSTDLHDTNWKESQIRNYLNSELMNEMFTLEEQARIAEVTITNPRSAEFYATYYPDGWYDSYNNPYGNTNDKLFLLSYEELIKYYGPLEKGADDYYYAYSGICTRPDGSAGLWWLRTPGKFGWNPIYVNSGGDVYYNSLVIDNGGVRPALWVNY